ncbi:hypothetical protein [Piscinibacter gummiphilus]|uniref:SnoaL-like domain-containing protein n=1 Tax=Piscinibacter gummiphilus TaxID=946333 RepID=A0ABZ0CT98_9BURK|nr:hypothetical protein [Piscinibacter gummiphilus]WOB08177.1 hypothetical protein RXV79_25155 [Piscinibacter gummiphilus]
MSAARSIAPAEAPPGAAEPALPPDIARVVADYVLVHFEPTRARVESLFTPGLRVYGNSLPPHGLDREAYLNHLRKRYGMVFSQAPHTRVVLTHDKRVVLRWTLSSGARRLAFGLDYLSVAHERISRIVGLSWPA